MSRISRQCVVLAVVCVCITRVVHAQETESQNDSLRNPISHAAPVMQESSINETGGLADVERILRKDGLDNQYLHYRRRPGTYHNFAAYMLHHSTRKYRSGRRLVVFGSVLTSVFTIGIVLGEVWINGFEEETNTENNESREWREFLEGLMLGVGIFGAVSGITLVAIGGYKVKKYGEWRRRLLPVVADSYLSGTPRWQGIHMCPQKGGVLLGTGVTF